MHALLGKGDPICFRRFALLLSLNPFGGREFWYSVLHLDPEIHAHGSTNESRFDFMSSLGSFYSSIQIVG